MSSAFVLLCAPFLLSVPSLFLPVSSFAENSISSPFVQAARLVRPAVVNIRCIRSVTDEGVGTSPLQEMFRRFFPDQEGQGGKFEMPSTGSGFVVDSSGFILTNFHVIAESEEVFVRFTGEQREYRGELVGSDPNTDLALLKIDTAGRVLPYLEFGDSDAWEVGSWAIAVGNPFGTLESTLTVGVVSAKGRGDLVIGGMTPRYQDFIQTDASINFGNSGGPLVNVDGLVMGVNTAINKEGRGIGFAVPSRLVQDVYKQLRSRGRVVRGYLGIRTEDIIPVVGDGENGEPISGVRILSLASEGPGAMAGLHPGDVVTRFNNQAVHSRRQLQFLIAGAGPGREVPMVVQRDGREVKITAAPLEWNDDIEDAATPDSGLWLGLEVASLEGGDPRVMRLKQTLGVTATSGVMVVAVAEESPAMVAGVRPGDVLLSVNGREVLDPGTFANIRGLLLHHSAPVTLLVRTGTVEHYVSVLAHALGVEN